MRRTAGFFYSSMIESHAALWIAIFHLPTPTFKDRKLPVPRSRNF